MSRKVSFIYGGSPFSTRLRSTRTLCNLRSLRNWPAEEEFLLTKAYYVVYGWQATILKANEKLNEEEQARGRGREERVNLYFPLLPFPVTSVLNLLSSPWNHLLPCPNFLSI